MANYKDSLSNSKLVVKVVITSISRLDPSKINPWPGSPVIQIENYATEIIGDLR